MHPKFLNEQLPRGAGGNGITYLAPHVQIFVHVRQSLQTSYLSQVKVSLAEILSDQIGPATTYVDLAMAQVRRSNDPEAVAKFVHHLLISETENPVTIPFVQEVLSNPKTRDATRRTLKEYEIEARYRKWEVGLELIRSLGNGP